MTAPTAHPQRPLASVGAAGGRHRFRPIPLSGERALRDVRVLLVDDDAEMRRVLRAMLELYGAEVTACASAAEARRVLAAGVFDVLLSDLMMPTIDGYQLIAELRNRERREGLPFTPAIAVTGFAENPSRSEEAGFQLHLLKPIEPERLAGAVRSVLTERADG